MEEPYNSEGELNYIMEEEKTPEREENIGPDVLSEDVRAAKKEMKKKQIRRNCQYTSRDAQNPRGRSHNRTDNNTPRYMYVHNGGAP